MNKAIAVLCSVVWALICLSTLQSMITNQTWPPLWWVIMMLAGMAFCVIWLIFVFKDPYAHLDQKTPETRRTRR